MLLAFANNIFSKFVAPVTSGWRYFLASLKPRYFLTVKGVPMITTPTKLAQEVWNIGVDFSPQLQIGETLSTGAASIVTGSATVAFANISSTIATVTVTGGLAGELCAVQVSVNTSTGEVLSERLNISVL